MLYQKVIDMGSVSFTDTSGLSREKWLELRRTGVGGSDAGAIMGLNRYSTPLSVYLDKKNLASREGSRAAEWGNILEDPIRRKARADLEIEIETVPGMFRNKELSFMCANFDGLVLVEGEREIAGGVVSGLGGHEIKTSRTGEGFTKDEIPDSYYCQVQHYMAVTGLPWFILTVFIFDRYEGNHYVIPRNEEFIERLIGRETDFWENNVLADVAPSPTGNESELELVKSLPIAEEVELDGECEKWLDEKEALDVQIKELQARSDAIKERILMRMSAAGGGERAEKSTAMCGGWKITCSTQVSRRVDTGALKKAGLYDEFSRETVSRVMRITRAKAGA